MNILGKAFPGIYEKRFYKRICEILAFVIYALALMLIFGLLSSEHNSESSSRDAAGLDLAKKVRSGIHQTELLSGETVLSISRQRVDDLKEAIKNKDKKRAAEIVNPVIKKAGQMKEIEAVAVE